MLTSPPEKGVRSFGNHADKAERLLATNFDSHPLSFHARATKYAVSRPVKAVQDKYVV